jgi:septal ring factor EnvC (AmiA/AmiB activator)
MGCASDKLMQLRPVTFRYKQAAEDGAHPLQYGLIAEEVAKVYPDLVQYDAQGKPFTVYYHLLTTMLLNELQKAHRQAVAQCSEIATQKSQIATLKHENAARKSELAALKQSRESEFAAMRRENADMKSELAALKQAQQQQLQTLAKLTALVQTSRYTEQAHPVAYVSH